ncbi:MAG TPA: acetolactate synthase 2 catalytic subunit [Vicinamibacteria bacterium]|nr:acetolactate synthase 2 catalytic subunit [Vicinamibacteria bacterium]
MNAATFLIRALAREGADIVFGYPGGAIMPVYDALHGGSIRHVLVRHEQGAALAADGYARATGRVGVCLATSGPGATNLVTGIANAFMDSVPLVAITGQVPTGLLGTDAFQEVDIFGMTLPIVKHSFLVRRAGDLPEAIHEAFRIARSGRPGPVLVDLPKDVAAQQGELAFPDSPEAESPPKPEPGEVRRARDLLECAKRPIVYAGGGIGIGRAVEAFRRFIDVTGIPTVTTLKGIGALGSDHPLLLGMLGMHGSEAANLAVQRSDLLVVIGARFDDRATGRLASFAPGAKVIHIDIDPAEVGKLRRPDVGLVGSIEAFLEELSLPLALAPHRRECLEAKARYRWSYDAPTNGVYGPRFLKRLSENATNDLIITCDVGQHQMWVAQHCRFERPEQHLSSGGLGTMGYGLPAAIGAQLGRPEATVVNVSGDGSFMMNLQELATVKRYGLPIKIVVMDNKSLGLVRQWQELFFGRRFSEVALDDNPCFARVAEAFGIEAFGVQAGREEESAIDRLFASKGPALLHVEIDPEANVWPLVPPNCANEEMLVGAHR